MTSHRYRLAFRVFLVSQHPVPIRKNWGYRPRGLGLSFRAPWAGFDGSHRFRLSWDSFARALPLTSPSCVHSRQHSESRTLARSQSLDECHLRRLAATLVACSALVGSHHLDGLLRVTASDVLQSEPARIRCVALLYRPSPSGKPDPKAKVEPFPQRGHPTKNLLHRQAVTPLGAPVTLVRLPPRWCRPESLSPLLGPLQGFTPSTIMSCSLPRCRFLEQPSSFHGFLYLQRFRSRSLFLLQDVT